MSLSMWQKLRAPITASTVPPAEIRCPVAVVSLTYSSPAPAAVAGARRPLRSSALPQASQIVVFLSPRRNRMAANRVCAAPPLSRRLLGRRSSRLGPSQIPLFLEQWVLERVALTHPIGTAGFIALIPLGDGDIEESLT